MRNAMGMWGAVVGAGGDMEKARDIWDELGLPALQTKPPWHGYSLGDWADVWTTYAERAVRGDWEESGRETYAARRGGLTPETPVRDVPRHSTET